MLTADDYAYMLQNSRAQAAMVSAALLPVLEAAVSKSDNEVRSLVVSRPVDPADKRVRLLDNIFESYDPLPGRECERSKLP